MSNGSLYLYMEVQKDHFLYKLMGNSFKFLLKLMKNHKVIQGLGERGGPYFGNWTIYIEYKRAGVVPNMVVTKCNNE